MIKFKHNFKILVIGTIALLVFIIIKIASTNNNDFSKDVTIYTEFQSKYEGSMKSLSGFEGQCYYETGIWQDSKALHDTTINLKNNDDFNSFFSLNNNTGETNNFTLIIFDNYKQIDFIVDNQTMNQCTVKVENDNEIEIPITISALKKGKHELMFVILTDTYKEIEENERAYIGSMDSQLRCTVIIDNNTELSEEFIPSQFETITARTDGICMNKFDGENYSIEVGNLGEQTKQCVIILLDNCKQIAPFIDSTQPYYYAEINPNNEIIMPLQDYIESIKDDGEVHEISAICVTEVGNNYDNFSGTVYFSNRIILE